MFSPGSAGEEEGAPCSDRSFAAAAVGLLGYAVTHTPDAQETRGR